MFLLDFFHQVCWVLSDLEKPVVSEFSSFKKVRFTDIIHVASTH